MSARHKESKLPHFHRPPSDPPTQDQPHQSYPSVQDREKDFVLNDRESPTHPMPVRDDKKHYIQKWQLQHLDLDASINEAEQTARKNKSPESGAKKIHKAMGDARTRAFWDWLRSRVPGDERLMGSPETRKFPDPVQFEINGIEPTTMAIRQLERQLENQRQFKNAAEISKLKEQIETARSRRRRRVGRVFERWDNASGTLLALIQGIVPLGVGPKWPPKNVLNVLETRGITIYRTSTGDPTLKPPPPL
jgi:hypothetical protein